MRISLRGVGTLAMTLSALGYSAATARAETNVLAAKTFISMSQSAGIVAALAAGGPVSSPAAAVLSAGMAELSVLRGDLAEAFANASTLSTEEIPPDLLMAISEGLGLGRGLMPTGHGSLSGGHSMFSNRAPHHNHNPAMGQNRRGGGGGGGGRGGGQSFGHAPATGHRGGSLTGSGTRQDINPSVNLNNLHLTYFPKGLGTTSGGKTSPTPKSGK